MTDKPVHIVALAGDSRSMCGIKDALPVVLKRHAPSHRYVRHWCPVCVAAADLEMPSPPEVPGQIDLFGGEVA